jgi:ankyrin repeat protein
MLPAKFPNILTSVCCAALALPVIAFGASSSPVADAAMNGDLAAVRALIQQKADVNAPQSDGATAIQWAAYRNDLPLAGVLIEAGANVKAANREGATPLYLASLEGSAALVQRLLEAGADANEVGPQGESPLMLAARSGNLESIKLLLDHKSAINAKEKLRGTTALMWAVEQSHPAAVKLLIERGADVSMNADADAGGKPRNNLANPKAQRQNSLFGAGFGGAGNAAAAGARPPAASGPPPQASAPKPQAPRKSAAEVAQALTDAGVDPNLLTGFGLDLGNLPAGVDVSVLIQQLGQFGFGKPVKDGGGLTALVLAAREDCLECAQSLIGAGANVNQITNYGWTALLTATQNRHYGLASYLLQHGANPNLANNGGWTPLYLATDNRNIESGDYPVRTPDMDHLDFIKLLLDKGANVNARVCGPQSKPQACTGDSTETRTNFTMQWLFEEGATAFLRAAQSGDVELMKLLLAHGADPHIYTAHNVTPLAVASGIGWVEGVTFEWSEAEATEAVKMCLALGIDPNVADDEGRTALHGAAHKGRADVIQLLADAGAKLDARDGGSRDTVNGDLVDETFIPLDWARGLVRVGVQSAIAHPDAEKLLVKLMEQKGIPVPPPPKSSICLTKGINGCQ